VVHADGTTENVTLDAPQARELYREAFAAAKNAGLQLQEAPIELKPQDKLVSIVKESQYKALAGDGGEDDDTQGK